MICMTDWPLYWIEHYKSNNFNYRFEEKGSGTGGSDADKEIRWFMNNKFRLALLINLNSGDESVIDFTRYDISYKEPESGSTRNWSVLGEINQKQTRPQVKPVPKDKLSNESITLISEFYPWLLTK